MIRALSAAAVIVLGATATVTLLNRCCSSAHAQTQAASPEPEIWDHNGSVMYLVENGSSREFYYQKPRVGMLEAGAHPGSLLFRGQVDNEQYSGTAYIFNPQCGPIPFQVTGSAVDNGERIILTGQAPQVGRNCRSNGSYVSNLEFRRLNSTKAGPSQEAPVESTQAPSVELSRSETPEIQAENSRSELAEPKVSPGTPTAQPRPTNEAPSAAKDLDIYVWAAAVTAVVLVVWAAAMLVGA